MPKCSHNFGVWLFSPADCHSKKSEIFRGLFVFGLSLLAGLLVGGIAEKMGATFSAACVDFILAVIVSQLVLSFFISSDTMHGAFGLLMVLLGASVPVQEWQLHMGLAAIVCTLPCSLVGVGLTAGWLRGHRQTRGIRWDGSPAQCG